MTARQGQTERGSSTVPSVSADSFTAVRDGERDAIHGEGEDIILWPLLLERGGRTAWALRGTDRFLSRMWDECGVRRHNLCKPGENSDLGWCAHVNRGRGPSCHATGGRPPSP
jgi:hypothetical protein